MKAKDHVIIALCALLAVAVSAGVIHARGLKAEAESLRRELVEQKVKHVIEVDSITMAITGEMIRSIRVRDSLEQERFSKLQYKQLQLIQQYEKSYSDYSSIVIDRPEF